MPEMTTKEQWNKRYSDGESSGKGSYGVQANNKLALIRDNIKDIGSILDIGCGDFAFGSRICDLFPKASYFGYDISDIIVLANKKYFPKYHFGLAQELYHKADLVLCMDVLFHTISPEEQEQLLNQLDQSWIKYLCITADESVNDVSQFGEPLIRELIEGSTAYLYIWRR